MIKGFVGSCLLALALTGAASAQPAQAADRWPVEAMHGPSFDFRATFDEATWISIDVSPDGRLLVFDILGDLYTMPIAGGEATRITQGPSYDTQPRLSPDGRSLVFVSDRGGSNALWLAASDGRGARQLTRERGATLSSPAWSHDGRSVVALRHDDLDYDESYDLFSFDVSSGIAVKLVDRKKIPWGPASSADGRSLHFSTQTAPGEMGIDRLDLRSGEIFPVVRVHGGASRPALSPDGRWLAYGRRFGSEERLILRDLTSGREETPNVTLNWDRQDVPASDGDLLPGYAFTPDSKSVIFTALGKIWRYELGRARAENIPFKARFSQKVHRRLAVEKRVERGPVALKLMRWTHQSPDGKTLFFSAAGKVYRYDMASRKARAIGDAGELQYSPSVSPDGRWLAFVGWTDKGAARIYRTPVERFAPTPLTVQAGHYEHLAWSPDSTKLVFLKSSGGELRGEGNLAEALSKTVVWIDIERPTQTNLVATVPPRGERRQEMRPSFNSTGDRIYYTQTPGRRQPTTLYSVALDGSGRKPHAKFRFADDIIPSPDEKWVAFTQHFEVYLAPFSPDAEAAVEIDADNPAQRITRLSREGGYFVNWADGGRAVTWGWGPDYFRRGVGEASAKRTHIDLQVPRAVGSGRILLRGGRLITMGPTGIIDRGDLLIENDRIAAIGPVNSLAAEPGTEIMDVSGKTIIPGLIDLHNHYRQGRNVELFPELDWGYVIQLAYGVTTLRDPSTPSQQIFTQAEMVETGASLGPRIFSTGQPVYYDDTYFSRPLASLDDARLHVRRLKALGATSVKQYIQPRREQRQWLVKAAREEGLPAVAEGAEKIAFDLTLLMDGHSTLEHAIKTAPLYKDVTSLFAATGTYLVPVLTEGPGGSAEEYFYSLGEVARDEKLMRFTPPSEIVPKDRLKLLRARDGFFFQRLARASAAIVENGGRVALGAHGNLEGLGVHWEMWAMADGGLSPLDTLRASTIYAADALGMARDIGSLEVGKIADLAILDADPIADIRNTNTVSKVMNAGRLWDAETMDRLWPQQEPFPDFYWRKSN